MSNKFTKGNHVCMCHGQNTNGSQNVFGSIDYSAEEHEAIEKALHKKLGPSFISQRNGPSGQKLAYVEVWRIVSLANEIFGFNGWSHSITDQTTDFVDHYNGRYYVGVSAKVRVELKDGVYHEDIGYGTSEGMKSKGMSLEKAKKEAVNDGIKRALKSFGNALGNCLSSKDYLKFVTKNKPLQNPISIDSNSLLYKEQQPGIANIRKAALIHGKDVKKCCIENKTTELNTTNSLGLQIPTPPPSIATEECFLPGIENAKNDSPPLHNLQKIGESSSFPSWSSKETLDEKNEALTSKVTDNSCKTMSDTNCSTSREISSDHKNKSPLDPFKNPLHFHILFNENSQEARSDSPNSFVGFNSNFKNTVTEEDVKIVDKPCSSNEIREPIQVVVTDTGGSPNLESNQQAMEKKPKLERDPTVEALNEVFGEDDPDFWAQFMSEQLKDAEREEENTHTFAQSLGLVPSKTHEKYVSCADTNPSVTVGSHQQYPAVSTPKLVSTPKRDALLPPRAPSHNLSRQQPSVRSISRLPTNDERPLEAGRQGSSRASIEPMSLRDLRPKGESGGNKKGFCISKGTRTSSNTSLGVSNRDTLWGIKLENDPKVPFPSTDSPSDGYHDFSFSLSNFFEESIEAICEGLPSVTPPVPKSSSCQYRPSNVSSIKPWKSPRTKHSLNGILKPSSAHFKKSKSIKISPCLHSKKRKVS